MHTKLSLALRKIVHKIRWQELLAVLILFLAFVFFRSERHEMKSILPQIKHAKTIWVIAGIALSGGYVLLQAAMYVSSFRAVGLKISLRTAIELFLKRNFLSVFLPAGGISSLAYETPELKRRNLEKKSIHQASAIYGFVGILTVIIVGIPVIIYAGFIHKNFGNSVYGLLAVVLVISFLSWTTISLRNKGVFYRFFEKYFPKSLIKIDEIFGGEISKKHFIWTILISILIEFCGIFHLLIAMKAFGTSASFSAAAIAYILTVLLMLASPFLRGLGAVEFSMIYLLVKFGFSHSQGLGVTLLYRTFEFWIPLLLGVLAYIWRGRDFIFRIIPAVSIFFLGLINMISVITPPLSERIRIGKIYFPDEVIHLSKILTLMAGIILIITSANMLRGLRRSWFIAVIFSIISLFGNLFKALDYEEATVAFLILLMLWSTRKEYNVKTRSRFLKTGIPLFVGVFMATFVFNLLSFYFIDEKHFGINFTKNQALYFTGRIFLFSHENGLNPKTGFAKDFLVINYILSGICWLLLIGSVFPFRRKRSKVSNLEDFQEAQSLVNLYGNSAMDYFKIAADKKLYFSEYHEGFVAYRVANNFAIALEEPVCSEEKKFSLLSEFEEFTTNSGLKTAYYRVDESFLPHFKPFKKKKLHIGEEGILDVEKFNLDGKNRKSIRNAVNTLRKKGFETEILYAPQNSEILDQLQKISDRWLDEFEKEEMVFSQGMFNREEIKHQDVIVLKNENAEIMAFLNIIPDYSPQECTYDLLRRLHDAPNGSTDVLLLKLVDYAKAKKLRYINLGLAPLAELEEPDNTAESLLKFVYNRLGSFKHYQSLREFKEKYADFWDGKYLVFSTDFDLLELPNSLRKVMRPT